MAINGKLAVWKGTFGFIRTEEYGDVFVPPRELSRRLRDMANAGQVEGAEVVISKILPPASEDQRPSAAGVRLAGEATVCPPALGNFFADAGRRVEVREGEVAVAAHYRNPRKVWNFVPVGFEAKAWNDVLAFAKNRPVVRVENLGYDHEVFFLGEPDPQPQVREEAVKLGEYDRHKMGPACEALARRIVKRCGHKYQDFQVPVRRTFQSTGPSYYSALQSYWEYEALVRVEEATVLQLVVAEKFAAVYSSVTLRVVSTLTGIAIWEYTGNPVTAAHVAYVWPVWPSPRASELYAAYQAAAGQWREMNAVAHWREHFRKKGFPRGVAKRYALAAVRGGGSSKWDEPYLRLGPVAEARQEIAAAKAKAKADALYQEIQEERVAVEAAARSAWEETKANFVAEWQPKVGVPGDWRGVKP